MAIGKGALDELSRRERQIMEVLYARGRASVGEVLEDLKDAPSYSAVRTLIRVLEAKGHVRHFKEGTRYVYSPVITKQTAARSALKKVVDTFFKGSVSGAVAMLVENEDLEISEEDLQRLEQLVAKAREAKGV